MVDNPIHWLPAITKDRLYRTLTQLLRAQPAIENDLKENFGTLFHIPFDLLLYDLTSSYFEGLAEANDLAKRGYSRDHRSDCKRIVIALVVTRDGLPASLESHTLVSGFNPDVTSMPVPQPRCPEVSWWVRHGGGRAVHEHANEAEAGDVVSEVPEVHLGCSRGGGPGGSVLRLAAVTPPRPGNPSIAWQPRRER
jgi:hypothetical protein